MDWNTLPVKRQVWCGAMSQMHKKGEDKREPLWFKRYASRNFGFARDLIMADQRSKYTNNSDIDCTPQKRTPPPSVFLKLKKFFSSQLPVIFPSIDLKSTCKMTSLIYWSRRSKKGVNEKMWHKGKFINNTFSQGVLGKDKEQFSRKNHISEIISGLPNLYFLFCIVSTWHGI